MKKNIFATVLLSGLVLSAAAPTALAVEQADGSSVETSRVEVNLKEDKGHEPGTGPFKDKLAIAHKPTVFKFEGETTTGSLNLHNKHQKKDEQYLAVNDDRKDAEGKLMSSDWSLTGQLSDLTADAKKLTGNMVFKPTKLQQYNIGELITNSNGVRDYKPAEVVPGTPEADAAKYELAKEVTLQTGGTAVEFIKSKNNTVTTPTGVFTNLGNVDLNIANGNAKEDGIYNGIITWTLAAQK